MKRRRTRPRLKRYRIKGPKRLRPNLEEKEVNLLKRRMLMRLNKMIIKLNLNLMLNKMLLCRG